jgi:hypothetical protein
MERATFRGLERAVDALGGVVQRTTYLSGSEAVVVHLAGRPHRVRTDTLAAAGWIDCRKAFIGQCTSNFGACGPHRAVCRTCGAVSRKLPPQLRDSITEGQADAAHL